jgi:hypothetical protein
MSAQELSAKLQTLTANRELLVRYNAKREPVGADFLGDDDGFRELCKLSTLREMSCTTATFTDEGFQAIRSLKELRELHIMSTGLTGRGLVVLGDLPSLTELHCNVTVNQREAVDAMTRCRNLKVLSVDQSEFDDSDFDKLFELPNLEDFAMTQNPRISDEAFRNIRRSAKLRRLGCSDNAIGDRACEHISKAPGLERLVIGATKVSDRGVGLLAKLASLKSVSLGRTNITPKSFELLAELPNLERLSVDEVDFRDEHIPLIARFPKLKILHLDETRMTREGAKRVESLREWEQFSAYPQIKDYEDD